MVEVWVSVRVRVSVGLGSGFVPTATIPQNILKKVKVMRDEARAIVEMATRVLSPALSTWLGSGFELGLA